MTLLLSNDDVRQVLDMRVCLDALEELYGELGRGEAVTFPRNDLHLPLAGQDPETPGAHYLKTMGGGSPGAGVIALRLSSDLVSWPLVGGSRRRVKLPVRPPDRWLGLVLLFSSRTGELLSIMQDGYLSRTRVGGTNGLAARYLAREDASTVGLIGSGWQAGAQLLALKEVRPLQRVRVFSPNAEHRAAFARQMEDELGVPVEPVASMKEAAREADILVTATNSRQPFLPPELLRPGMHLSCLQRDEARDETYRRVEHLVINTRGMERNFTSSLLNRRYGAELGEVRDHVAARAIDWEAYPTLGELVAGQARGRGGPEEVTGFVNNLGLGAQFAAVGARVYELARQKGLGRELETEWFLEDVHP